MRKINQLLKLKIIFLFTIFAILTPISAFADSNNKISNYENAIQEAIDRASEYMMTKDEGVISEWEAIGLTQAGKAVPKEYEDWFYSNIESQITNGLNSGRIKITDIERLSMAAVAIGKDPLNVNGHNLIELIYNSPDNRNGSDTMTFQGNNGPIFALIALDTLNHDVPEDARWTRGDLINELLTNQNEDGSWHLSNLFDSASIDITAMAMIGLSPYGDQLEVKEGLNKTLAYLSNVQTDNAGFDGGDFVGGITSEAASQVIIGLTAYGIDPTSEHFTKNDINLIDHLLNYQREDGGFKHTEGDSSSNSMATEQALQALVAYQYFIQGKGSLYDFTERNLDPEDPNEPEEPSNPEEPETPPVPEDSENPEGPEAPGEDHKDDSVIYAEENEEVEVSKGETVVVGDTTKVKLPDDLPAKTKLVISSLTNIPGNNEPAGDVYQFDFIFPEGADKPIKPYKLTMGFNTGIDESKVAIYYYNELTGTWEYVGGQVGDGEITAEVNHFSTYGVFTDSEGPTNVHLFVEKTTQNNVLLSFSAEDFSGIDHFILMRNGFEIAVIGGNETSYVDEDIILGETYEYELIAVDPLGNMSKGPNVTINIPNENHATIDKSSNDKIAQETSIDERNTMIKGEKLPSTATNMYTYLFIGMLLLLAGGLGLYSYRKKHYV